VTYNPILIYYATLREAYSETLVHLPTHNSIINVMNTGTGLPTMNDTAITAATNSIIAIARENDAASLPLDKNLYKRFIRNFRLG